MLDRFWSPKWDAPGASLWALANKLSLASTMPLNEVLFELVGAERTARLPAFAPGRSRSRQAAAVFGRCDPESLFTGIDVHEPSDRSRIRLSLAWCPICAEGWYHTPVFQLAGLSRCPWHGCALRTCCPHCWRPVDPLGTAAWTCDACGKHLADAPADALKQFQARPAHTGMPPDLSQADSWFAYQMTQQGDGWKCYSAEEGAPAEEGSRELLSYWHMLPALEEALALWDTVLHEHAQCAREEPNPYPAPYSVIEFKCPVASAALVAFTSLGITANPLGDWQVLHPKVRPVDMRPLYKLAPRARAAYARALTRTALHQALQVFGRVAMVGRWRTRWDEPNLTQVADVLPFQSQDAVGVLSQVSIRTLKASVAFAARSCVRCLAASAVP